MLPSARPATARSRAACAPFIEPPAWSTRPTTTEGRRRATMVAGANRTVRSGARGRPTLGSPAQERRESGRDPSAAMVSHTRRRAAASERAWLSRGRVPEPKTRSWSSSSSSSTRALRTRLRGRWWSGPLPFKGRPARSRPRAARTASARHEVIPRRVARLLLLSAGLLASPPRSRRPQLPPN